MKMHKVICLLLLIATVTCSCNINHNADIENQYYPSFKITSFSNISEKQLFDLYDEVQYFYESNADRFINTPYTVLFRPSNNSIMIAYDKKTGRFTSACKIAECTHEDCIWRPASEVYCIGDNLIFNFIDEYAIYITDLNGEKAKLLYEYSDKNVSYLYHQGSYIFFTESDTDVSAFKLHVCRLNIETGEREELFSSTEANWQYMIYNQGILYVDWKSMNAYTYNLNTGKTALFLESILPITVY